MGYGTRLMSRADWGARPRVCISHNIKPEGITVHYGGPSPWGRQAGLDRSNPERFRATAPHDRCASILRAYQAYHLDTRGWCDLAYNSAVCPHGVRYEGRGVGVRSGAQGTNDGNLRSYATVYLAGTGDPLTVEAKRAFCDEADRFHAPLRWGHRDWKSTSCPGDPTYAWRQAGFPRPPTGATPAPPPPTLPPPGGTVPVSLPILRPGMRGGTVRSLQALLVAKAGQGRTLHPQAVSPTDPRGVDGIYGSRTQQAVVNVQRFFHLPVTGVVEARTWATLFL